MASIKRIFVKTFGCQMNIYDTERIYRYAQQAGYERVDSASQADLIFVNTCSVREKPEHKAVSELGWMHKRARGHDNVKIAVAGCVAQQQGEALLKQLPYLDMVVGTGAIGRLPGMIDRIENGERLVDCGDAQAAELGMPDPCGTTESAGQVGAFVSIMRGCDNHCSYCIVPFVRGPETSRPMPEVLAEIESFVEQGAREVTLLGQNVNSYGKNLDAEVDFVMLLERAVQIENLLRIRFTTSHPKDLSPKLVELFATEPKLAGHMHLAVQSGSDRILARMNRRYTAAQYLEKIAALRRAWPAIAVTSDMIVGFCGETDRDFENTLDLMREARFDNLFSFMYSPRPNTAAEKMADDVPLSVKKERLGILQKLQQSITLEKNKAMVGRRVEILVEGRSRGGPDRKFGRTECFRVVHFDDPEASPGDLVAVTILDGFQNALVGRR